MSVQRIHTLVVGVVSYSGYAMLGDVYHVSDGDYLFFCAPHFGSYLIDEALTKSANDTCFYLACKDENLVRQELNPSWGVLETLSYGHELPTLMNSNALLKSPVTGKMYSGTAYSYSDGTGRTILFFSSPAFPELVEIDQSQFLKEAYALRVVKRYPVVIYPYYNWPALS